MLASGVEKIVYLHKYKYTDSLEAEKFVNENGKEIFQIELDR